MTFWRSLLLDAAGQVGSCHEARLLVEEASGLSFAEILWHQDAAPGPDAQHRFALLLERRMSGEPLQHVLGHWSFRTLELRVDQRALVPRPETEVVAGVALDQLALRRAELAAERRLRSGASQSQHRLRALDLGTGTGAIACAIVVETDDVEVVGVEASTPALSLARENRDLLSSGKARRIDLRLGDWYSGLACERFDCVVANPPYLADVERDDLDPVVRDFEPPSALFSGPTGLEAIEAVIAGAPRVLAAKGSLVVEIAPHQASQASALAAGAGATSVEIVPDLAGRSRVLLARW